MTINLDYAIIFAGFMLALTVGFLLESFFFKIHFQINKRHYKEHHFSFGKLIGFLIFPTILMIYTISSVNPNLFKAVIVAGIFGPFAEWMFGFFYQKFVGQRLWTYHRYSIGKHTSWVSVFLWGFGGTVFWLLFQIFA